MWKHSMALCIGPVSLISRDPLTLWLGMPTGTPPHHTWRKDVGVLVTLGPPLTNGRWKPTYSPFSVLGRQFWDAFHKFPQSPQIVASFIICPYCSFLFFLFPLPDSLPLVLWRRDHSMVWPLLDPQAEPGPQWRLLLVNPLRDCPTIVEAFLT